jgi:saccharopine dehydrogenase-like NADP-dependent oxidoreductase
VTAPAPRILVVGGYGAFGARVAERLVRSGDIEVIVAGRSLERARAAAVELGRSARAPVRPAVLDGASPDAATLRQLAPAVVVNASGPFQSQDYTLARAAIAAGAHYVDLADARAFVTGISALDEEAKTAGVLVVSGASSVPALSCAIVDHHRPDFARLDSIEHGITPGNGYDPGLATTESILGGLGQPMQMLVDGSWCTMHGWLGVRRIELPGLGARWMAHCDVPDLELFPRRFRGVRTVRFSAGLEVALFQLSLWLLATAARRGLLRRPERLARPLMSLKRWLRFLGSDTGGMFVRLEGEGRDGRPLVREIDLVARRNQGPYVPAIAAVVIARKLARGQLDTRGAMPCLGLMRLPEFIGEVADLDIEITQRC